jgi:hypothetical protein
VAAATVGNTQVFPSVNVKDDKTPTQQLKVEVRWSGFASGTDQMGFDGAFFGTVGPIRVPGQQTTAARSTSSVVARTPTAACRPSPVLRSRSNRAFSSVDKE